MSPFRVNVHSFEELREIDGAWSDEEFLALLERADFGDTSGLAGDELRGMCILALQDLEPAGAAALLLEHRLGDALEPGQIQNMSHEMLDEKLWEQYSEMELHERLFHVGSLLHQAFPQVFPLPDAVDARLKIEALDADAERVLAGALHESFLVRLLADGMPDSAQLKRLFADKLGGKPFPEAESIVWIATPTPVDARNTHVGIIGSGYWLDPLRQTESYTTQAAADRTRGD